MMTPDELRALADALDGCNPYRDSSAVYSVAAYLRAQADAQPVAWRYWREGDAESDWGISSFREGCELAVRVEPLYAAPAPTNAQREPLSDEQTRALLAEVERLRAAVTALVPIVEKERARLAINQQKAPERMASSYDGLIAPLDAALRLAGINMRSKE